MVAELAASLIAERQETGGGDGVRHSVETGAAVAAQAWDKSWEGKAAVHRERGTAQVEAWDADNMDPEDGRRCKRLRSDRPGSTYKG